MFLDLFLNLKANDRILILDLMIRMENSIPNKEIRIKTGLDEARIYEMDLSLNELLDRVKDDYMKAQGYSGGDISILDTYHTMISRNSRNKLYRIILKYMGVDEDFIQECYFRTLNEQELFDSLLPKDQQAILWYMGNIYRSFEVKFINITGNLGIACGEE